MVTRAAWAPYYSGPVVEFGAENQVTCFRSQVVQPVPTAITFLNVIMFTGRTAYENIASQGHDQYWSVRFLWSTPNLRFQVQNSAGAQVQVALNTPYVVAGRYDSTTMTRDMWIYDIHAASWLGKASGSGDAIPSGGNEIIWLGRSKRFSSEFLKAQVPMSIGFVLREPWQFTNNIPPARHVVRLPPNLQVRMIALYDYPMSDAELERAVASLSISAPTVSPTESFLPTLSLLPSPTPSAAPSLPPSSTPTSVPSLPTMVPTPTPSHMPSPAPTPVPTSTPVPTRVPPLIDEDFESGLGVFSNTGTKSWRRHIWGTGSSGTGPHSDHTTGSGYYMYVEASSPNYPNVEGFHLEAPCASVGEVSFWYHMYGVAMGTLDLETSADRSTWKTVWSKSRNQGYSWQAAVVFTHDEAAAAMNRALISSCERASSTPARSSPIIVRTFCPRQSRGADSHCAPLVASASGKEDAHSCEKFLPSPSSRLLTRSCTRLSSMSVSFTKIFPPLAWAMNSATRFAAPHLAKSNS